MKMLVPSNRFHQLLWTIGLCVFLESVVVSGEPCSGAVRLGHPSRSVNYELDYYDFPLCDSGLIQEDLWYRFDSEGNSDHLAEECPKDVHCGTLMPIWMDGEHPKNAGDMTTARACGSWSQEECCGWSAEIKVKKCHGEGNDPDFFVYHLVDPPFCDAAYCTDAGGREPCERGLEYNPDLKKCVPHHPAMTSPVLSGPIVLDNVGAAAKYHPKYFAFECEVGYELKETDDGARFEVTFTFNGEAVAGVPPVEVTSLEPKARLRSRQLKGLLGKTIKCSVVSYWSFDPTRRSPPISSVDGYFAGIKTDPVGPVSMKEGEIIEVNFISTIPILFPKHPLYRRRASLAIRVRGHNRHSRGASCQVRLKANSWTGADNPTNVTLRIKAIPDMGTKTQFIQAATNFQPIKQLLMEEWTDYTVNSIIVNIQDQMKSVTCKSTGDPHITTFDGKYYHNFLVGDFLLWKSTDPSLHFEIHVRQLPWHRRPVASANCAVAVREHNTILGIDRCRGDPARFITFLSEDTKRGYIKRHNNRYYEIIMASGVSVRVYFWDTIHISLHAVAPGHHHGRTEGMCGSYNGNKEDDLTLRDTGKLHPGENQQFPNKFSESYRIHPTKSYFRTTVPCLEDSVPTYRCKCQGLQQAARDRFVECGFDGEGNEVTTVKAEGMECGLLHRHKRSADPEEIDDETDDVVPLDQLLSAAPEGPVLTPPDLSVPTEGGITMDAARQKCNDEIRFSPSYNQCHDIVNVEEVVESCATDAMLADTYDSVKVVGDELTTACIVQAEANVVIQVNNGTRAAEENNRHRRSASSRLTEMWGGDQGYLMEENNPSVEKLKSILMSFCPGNCNGRGTCVEGTCSCEKGFMGDDCSVSETIAPVISSVAGLDGHCDLRTRACKKFRLIVKNTAEKFSCRFTQKHYMNDSVEVLHSRKVDVVLGEYVTIGEVICHLPYNGEIDAKIIAVGYEVSITNDGRTFSDPVTLGVHDSTCVGKQEGTMKYHFQGDGCLINRHCHQAGATKPRDHSRTCKPEINKYQWSSQDEEAVLESWLTTHVTLIVVIVVQVLVIILVIVLVALIIKRRQRTKSSKPDTNPIISRSSSISAISMGNDNPLFNAKISMGE